MGRLGAALVLAATSAALTVAAVQPAAAGGSAAVEVERQASVADVPVDPHPGDSGLHVTTTGGRPSSHVVLSLRTEQNLPGNAWVSLSLAERQTSGVNAPHLRVCAADGAPGCSGARLGMRDSTGYWRFDVPWPGGRTADVLIVPDSADRGTWDIAFEPAATTAAATWFTPLDAQRPPADGPPTTTVAPTRPAAWGRTANAAKRPAVRTATTDAITQQAELVPVPPDEAAAAPAAHGSPVQTAGVGLVMILLLAATLRGTHALRMRFEDRPPPS